MTYLEVEVRWLRVRACVVCVFTGNWEYCAGFSILQRPLDNKLPLKKGPGS